MTGWCCVNDHITTKPNFWLKEVRLLLHDKRIYINYRLPGSTSPSLAIYIYTTGVMSLSICVDNENSVDLTYTDSGAPTGALNTKYVTIIAIHGFGFSAAVFNKILTASPRHNVRFVSVNRRGYGESTPFSPADLNVLTSGTDEERQEFVAQRGRELLTFVDAFIQASNIPSIGEDYAGRQGGIILLGWSLGAYVVLSALTQLEALPADKLAKLRSYLNSVIIHELPYICLGRPFYPKFWTPLFDMNIPEEKRGPMFVEWITSYFEHGDVMNHDFNTLSYIDPSKDRVPTVFRFTSDDIVSTENNSYADNLLSAGCLPQLSASFEEACFNKQLRGLLPDVQIYHLCGDMAPAFGVGAAWDAEDVDKRHGGGFIEFKFIKDANHFMFWDEPERALRTYLDCIRRSGMLLSHL